MKKLNRKGFTLIELLAIIVILAIIMVVTIPSILDVVGSTTSKQFKNSADAIEKWVSDTYVLAAVGQGDTSGATATFLAVCDRANTQLCTYSTLKKDATKSETQKAAEMKKTSSDASKGFVNSGTDKKVYDLLLAAGQVPKNYKSLSIDVDSTTNRVCVIIEAASGGDFAEVSSTKSNGCK